jgi:alpha-glucosidase
VAEQVFYQIFPDRFARSEQHADQQDNVYYHHAAGQEIVLRDWDEPLSAEAGGSTFTAVRWTVSAKSCLICVNWA